MEAPNRPFPVEPIRTLDAIHLASALLAASAAEDFAVLTLDERIRNNAIELGLEAPQVRSATKPANDLLLLCI